MFGGDRAVIEAYDELDGVGDFYREGGVSFVTVIVAERTAVVVELDGECLVDLVGRSANDDASSGGVGFAHLQIVGKREVDHFLKFDLVGAMGGGKVLVGDVPDTGKGGVLKVVQAFHGFPSGISSQDQSGGDLFIGVGGPELFISGRTKMFAVGELDVVFGQIGLSGVLCCWHKKSLEGDQF